MPKCPSKHPIKICARCGEVKPVDAFGWRNKEHTLRNSRCAPCERAHAREKYHKSKGDKLTRPYVRRKPLMDEEGR